MHPARSKHALLLASFSLAVAPLLAAEPEGDAALTPPVIPGEAAPLTEIIEPDLRPALDTDLPADAAPAAAAAATDSVTINLIQRLVEKGILDREEAAEMIEQARNDAAAVAAASARADIAALPPAPSLEEEMAITYIPDVVRNQMRDQIEQELLARAREEKWSEKQYPEWTTRFRPFGDIRVRSENTFFPDGNDNSGAFPNFNAINTGAPFDTAGTQFSPQYNVDQDRHRSRLRARFGTELLLGDGFDGGLRLATGNDSSPTSTNQSLGSSGGNFSKYQVWLDRAFIRYDAGPGDGQELVFSVGRFDNPYFSSDVLWDDDLGFDGLAVRGRLRVREDVHTFFTAGYFPVYNTDFNFASNQPSKFDSDDKWLLGLQAGVEWNINEDLTAKFGVAYYDFDGIQGELSSPFIPLSPTDAGDSDATRPSFAQRGNTYMALRDIDNSTAANDFGNRFQYQYYGLASEFENLALTARLDYDGYDPFRISLAGEFVKNLAFNSSDINRIAVNNRGPSQNGNLGRFDGGDTAWFANLVFGKPALEELWDWQAAFGYRYVESDAVVDAFTDSDFGGGGTNVQGFTVGANFAINRFARWGIRWMSADEITGPPLSSDILQIDFNARF